MAHKKFFCIDAHTCGNPVRLVAGGGPLLEGNSMMEKRLHFLREYDWIRKGLMFEPRGHDMMSGSILYPPHDPQNDIGVLFIGKSSFLCSYGICYSLCANYRWRLFGCQVGCGKKAIKSYCCPSSLDQ